MWTAVSVFLYLLPIAGFFVVRARPGRSALSVALDIPLAVSADFIFTLLLSRLVVLDYAAFFARGIECGCLIGYGWRRRKLMRAAIAGCSRNAAGTAALGGLLAFYISSTLSRPYAIWDRHWHLPLVASLRGQNAPFHNVYEPDQHFFYHYSGDALGAIFQALSFVHLHASAALSRAHDVLYTLLGLFLALALRAFGVKGAALILLVILCTLAGGPATLLFEGPQRWGNGWSFVNLLSLSFRPHEPLSYLFGAGLACATLGPLWLDDFKVRWTAVVPVAACASVLSLSDEPTLVFVVGALGLAWLLKPTGPGVGWPAKLLMMATPLVATIVTLLLLGGTFSLGAPHQSIKLVDPRVPGYYVASLPLNREHAFETLLIDYLAPLGVMLSGVISAFVRRDTRGWLLLAAHVSLLVGSLAVLTFVEVNHNDMESHRAVTGLMLLGPLLLALWHARLPEGGARSWVLALGGFACVTGVLSTVEWVRGPAKVDCLRSQSFWGSDHFYETDCVAQTGARLGEQPLISVGPQDRWYLFGGCRPVYAPPGGPPGGHAIVVGWPDADASAFAKAAELSLAPAGYRLFYPKDTAKHDTVAREIAANASGCRAAGSDFVECATDARGYAAFLQRRDKLSRKPSRR